MNDIGAYCEDGAGVELVQLIIGGKMSIWVQRQHLPERNLILQQQ